MRNWLRLQKECPELLTGGARWGQGRGFRARRPPQPQRRGRCRAAGPALPPRAVLLLGGEEACPLGWCFSPWSQVAGSHQGDVSSWAADREAGRPIALSPPCLMARGRQFGKGCRGPWGGESREGCSLGPWVTVEGGAGH